MKILSVGEIIWDVFPDRRAIGGAPLNFAAHCALCGAQSALLSAVGGDPLGEESLKALADFGVRTDYVQTNSLPTGQCIVTLDENRIPSYRILRGVAYDGIVSSDGTVGRIASEQFDALYFGTLIQREQVSRRAVREIVQKCRFETVFCDVNLRPDCFDADSVAFCMENASILKVSMEEEPSLRALAGYRPKGEDVQSVAQAICERFGNVRILLLTLGEKGSFAYDARSRKAYRQEALGGSVVSTVGAGDSFSAAWLASYLAGKPIEACMRKAAEISGFVVAHTEAVPKY
jgi:fructokinase